MLKDLDDIFVASMYWREAYQLLLAQPQPASAPVGVEAERLLPPEWVSEPVGGAFDDITAGQAWRRGFNECRRRAITLIEKSVLAQQPAAVDEAWITQARGLYARCNLWPETTDDGFMALLELRNHVAAALAQPRASLNDRNLDSSDSARASSLASEASLLKGEG